MKRLLMWSGLYKYETQVITVSIAVEVQTSKE